MKSSDKASNFDFRITSFWGGYVSSFDKTNLSENLMVRGSQNIYKKLSGTLAVRPGQKRQGVANATHSAVSSEYVWNTSWGDIRTMVVSNSRLYAVIDEVWYTLLTGVTDTRYVFDKWWDNTEQKTRVLMVNGNNYIQHWSGGYTTILSKTINTITKTGTTSWAQEGFSSTPGEMTAVINGTTYTYTGGENTTTITGVSPDPTGEANGSVVLQSVITEANTPDADFSNDFIKVIDNQLYVGSYTSNKIFISSSTDFTDYVIPVPRVTGSPDLVILDGTGKGIGLRNGNPFIGYGTDGWTRITFANQTVGTDLTNVTTKTNLPVALGQAPLAHEFIDNVGDSLIYVAQDQQVRSLGDFNNLFVAGYPSFSQPIATELTEQNLTGGALKCIGEFIYLTVPVTGVTYLYQVRTEVNPDGQVVAERLWHSPFVWNITRIDAIDGVIVGFSNANPQIYELWDTNQWHDDSPSDEPLPYNCVLALSYRTLNRRQGLQSFDKTFSEGYITEGTPLNLLINYNYLGSTNKVVAVINSITQPATTFISTNPASLGDTVLGDNPLGQGINNSIDPQDAIPKFKVINSLPIINCFEYQPVYSSDTPDARWELLASGTNAEVETEQQATFIINKLRF